MRRLEHPRWEQNNADYNARVPEAQLIRRWQFHAKFTGAQSWPALASGRESAASVLDGLRSNGAATRDHTLPACARMDACARASSRVDALDTN